jgi:CO/xanthine dehydrogenase FAD-binding subunit
VTIAHLPERLDDALRALAEAEPRPVPIAGCTDLLVVDEATGRRHDAVLDLTRVAELRGVRLVGGALEVGATTTFSGLRADPLVREHAPLLAAAAATVGGWQIQNRGTLGGNVANASPAGDSLPVLLALDATVVLGSVRGTREVPVDAFFTGYRETELAEDELITRFRLPVVRNSVQLFRKVGTREAQAISKVVLAFAARRDGEALAGVRIAAGSVAATPVRLWAAEAVLEGQAPTAELGARAGAAARAEVNPIDDVRSTARYRSFVLERLVRRLVLEAGASGPR